MTAGRKSLNFGGLRAPQENRTVLIEPSLARVADHLAENIASGERATYDVQGRSLAALRAAAHADLLSAAESYTRQYRDVPATLPGSPILIAGHQPEIFHPGVWFKNFALDSLARGHHATAVNLLIDNDAVKKTSLSVPGGSIQEPVVGDVPFDRPTSGLAFEDREILDEPTFLSFGHRAASQIRPLVADPLVEELWPLVIGRSKEVRNLGLCIAQGRHILKGQIGLTTLEIPQSQICQLESFHWMTAHVLAQLPRFRQVYNDAVQTYRRVNHIRSANHPVPDLAEDGDWQEAPFWIWKSGSHQRGRLFVRPSGDELLLRGPGEIELKLPLAADKDAQRAVEVLAELPNRGIKLRTRALTTTLFARLFLGDLFLHGIGGAKYDQVTDRVIQQFFGQRPPQYMVLSATLHLPIVYEPFGAEQLRAVEHTLRNLTYHPETYAVAESPNAAGELAKLIEAKVQWVQTVPTRHNARRRCHEIRHLNESMQPFVEPTRERMLQKREQLARASRINEVLSSREYGFCLYPRKKLEDFMLEFFGPSP